MKPHVTLAEANEQFLAQPSFTTAAVVLRVAVYYESTGVIDRSQSNHVFAGVQRNLRRHLLQKGSES